MGTTFASSTHKKKRLIFLTSFTYPTHYAHPVWGLQMARAWASLLGNAFVFVIADAGSSPSLSGIRYVRVFARTSALLQKLHLRTLAYSVWLPAFLIRNRFWGKNNSIFANDPRLALIAVLYEPLFRYTLVFESHGEYTPKMRTFLYSHVDRIIFISSRLREFALTENAAYAGKSTVVLNGVDTEHFTRDAQPASVARKKLGIACDGVLIGYLGRFHPGGVDKGVSFMIRALPSLPLKYRMLFVGGIPDEIQEMETLARSLDVADRVLLYPFVPTDEIPQYASACDLLAYVPETIAFMQRETLPMKLFEYMAARRPVVVSDTPSVRELVDESCASFCEAGSVASFVSAVEQAAAAPASGIERAFERVKDHTWLARAERITNFAFDAQHAGR